MHKVSQVTVKDLGAISIAKEVVMKIEDKGVVPGCCKHANPALGGYSMQLFRIRLRFFVKGYKLYFESQVAVNIQPGTWGLLSGKVFTS